MSKPLPPDPFRQSPRFGDSPSMKLQTNNRFTALERQEKGAALSDQDEFVRQLRKFTRKSNMDVVVDKTEGKKPYPRVVLHSDYNGSSVDRPKSSKGNGSLSSFCGW
jgi:hypothetical protein